VQQAEGALATYTAAQLELEKRRALPRTCSACWSASPASRSPRATCAACRCRRCRRRPALGLLEARPDVRKAETDLIAANAKIGVAKAALFPSITLTGNFGRESKDLSQLFSAPSAVWSFGAGLTQPIFEGGRLRAQVDQVTAQQKQSLEATARRCRPPSAK
jgi:multidrug efflux system outer membrane protein